MADLRTLGMYQCHHCGALMAVEQHCIHCAPGAPEEVAKTACPGWGCPIRTGCPLYHTVHMKGSAHLGWIEPPYDHLTQDCTLNMPLGVVVQELTQALRKTIGRQNAN
jgi:hypothetical protein